MINAYRQEWMKDPQQRWINTSGKEAPNSDIINRIDLVIRTRQLTVTAHHCNNKQPRYEKEIAVLLRRAAEAIEASAQEATENGR